MRHAALVAAFSEDQVQRLTGGVPWTVALLEADWVVPSIIGERIYSFLDVASLRVLNVLRNQYRVSLQHLRKVSERLAHLEEKRWIGSRLYVLGRQVVFIEPDTDLPQTIATKQYVLPTIALEVVVTDTRRDIEALNRRTASNIGKVVQSRGVVQNAKVIAGTRIKVSSVKSFHAAGYSVDQIIRQYPDLSPEDVQAAIEYGENKAAA